MQALVLFLTVAPVQLADPLMISLKRGSPREELVEDDADGVDVRCARDARTQRLLWAEVGRGPEDLREALALTSWDLLFDDPEI